MTASDSSHETLASSGPTGAASTASTPGALLRSAREVQGLSIGDVSTRLRMGVRQIDALERGDYAALPTGTFLRGMVRNYAKIVNVDADAAIHLLESTYSHASVSLKDAKIVVPSQNIKVSGRSEFSLAKLKWLLLAIVAGAIAFGVWYSWDYIRPYFSGGARTTANAEKTTAVAPPQVRPAVSAPVVTAPQSSASSVPVAPPAPATASVTPAPVAPVAVTSPPALAESSSSSPVGESTKLTPDPAATARPAGSSLLGFTFAGESWVEVVDGRGRTLISKRFQSGETDEATGRPPFSIVVGNAAKVRMAYNGKEFDLTPHTKANSTVARFTLK